MIKNRLCTTYLVSHHSTYIAIKYYINLHLSNQCMSFYFYSATVQIEKTDCST